MTPMYRLTADEIIWMNSVLSEFLHNDECMEPEHTLVARIKKKLMLDEFELTLGEQEIWQAALDKAPISTTLTRMRQIYPRSAERIKQRMRSAKEYVEYLEKDVEQCKIDLLNAVTVFVEQRRMLKRLSDEFEPQGCDDDV